MKPATSLNGSQKLTGIQQEPVSTSTNNFQMPPSLGFSRLKGLNTANLKTYAVHETWDQRFGNLQYSKLKLVNSLYPQPKRRSSILMNGCVLFVLGCIVAVSFISVSKDSHPPSNQPSSALK